MPRTPKTPKKSYPRSAVDQLLQQANNLLRTRQDEIDKLRIEAEAALIRRKSHEAEVRQLRSTIDEQRLAMARLERANDTADRFIAHLLAFIQPTTKPLR